MESLRGGINSHSACLNSRSHPLPNSIPKTNTAPNPRPNRSHLPGWMAACELGCNALQIFSASPRMWQGGPARIPDADARAFRARREELGLGPLVIHANYLINLAASQPMLRTRSIQAFHDDLVRGIALGADFLVVHPGSRGESSAEQAIATIIESVKQAARRV